MIIEKIKEFHLVRKVDVSGTSGIGTIAMGVILSTGRCVLEFLGTHPSINIYNNIADVELIHGHGGTTEVVMGPPKKKKKK